MERENSGYIIRLGELSREDVERIGAEAANLSELMKAGLPVPDGFSLTTFQVFLDSARDLRNSSRHYGASLLPVGRCQGGSCERRRAQPMG